MAPIIAAAPSRRRYTYRGYRRHPRSILFCIVMIALIVKLGFFIHSHLSILSPPEDLTPAKPVERLDIPMLSKYGEPLSSWKTAWIVHQELDSEVTDELKQACTLDLVYTWVNGSDPDLEAMRQRYKNLSPAFATMAMVMSSGKGARRMRKVHTTLNRFRDMDELRYSLRSVAQYADAGLFRRIHILTTDVEEQQEDQERSITGERVLHQQTPQWLDLEKAQGVIKLVRHREIYEDLAALPSFNSLSIESQMHRIPGLADNFVYLNDDVFFGNPINSASLWTPLYGFVFHLDTLTTVDPAPAGLVEDISAVGEWPSLIYTNSILSKQFGARHRVYLAHIPHVLSVSLMNEIQALWPQEFSKTSQHRFRGEGQAREIQVSFLLAHYVMERLRETQLKSYWAYRLDRNQDGRLDWNERQQLLEMVETYDSAMVKRREAGSQAVVKNDTTGFLKGYDDRLSRAEISINVTTYALSGQDEYPFMLASGNLKKSSRVQNKRPYYVKRGERQCVFEVEFCLGAAFRNQTVPFVDASTGAGSIFERMAFTEFHCGDCLLHILRHAGEAAGSSAIMPLDRTSKAFGEVAADLYKYNYVVGQTDFAFLQLKNAKQAEGALNGLMRRKEVVSFFCINDDVPDNALMVKKVRSVFSAFLKRRFPVSSPWEKKPGLDEEAARKDSVQYNSAE